MEHKVFFWLLLQNRLNTRAMLQRRHLVLDSYSCELCLRKVEESNRFLFFRCSFGKNCWMKIGVMVPGWLRPERLKRSLGVPFALEIIMIMSWCI
jgi:hypothetical protein